MMIHRIYIGILFLVSFIFIFAVIQKGWNYYILPQSERVFLDEHKFMKPSGGFSHTLGVIGAGMVIIGITSYSLRKRIKRFWNLGKISYWLEFHIFLCLLGTALVIFHSTFKSNGVAGISLWTMLAVALSGIIGRFLYRLIPRNYRGGELNSTQILVEIDKINKDLKDEGITMQILHRIDENFTSVQSPKRMKDTFSAFIKLQKVKKKIKKMLIELPEIISLPKKNTKNIHKLISFRAALIQKGIIISQVEKLFFYWHAIHFPFTIIMFITFAFHILAVILIGYHWIF